MFPNFERAGNEFLIPLTIFGPDNKQALHIDRKLLLQDKNWRLNGAFIFDPLEDKTRFHDLQVGDFALLGFEGEEYPTAVDMLLIGKSYPQDAPVWNYINLRYSEYFDRRGGFRQIERSDIEDLSQELNLGFAYSVNRILDKFLVEEAIAGNMTAIQEMTLRGCTLTMEQYEQAKMESKRTGHRGEAFIYILLSWKRNTGAIQDYKWQSIDAPFSPFDFIIQTMSGLRKLEVKSTKRSFNERIYISIGELVEMAESAEPYDIIRVYEMSGGRCKYRIAADVGSWAAEKLSEINALSFKVDAIIVDPQMLQFADHGEIIDNNAQEQ